MTDHELIIRFTGGDDQAFVSLYQRHKEAVYRYCLRMLDDGDAAEDVVQAIFVRMYQRRERLKQPSSFRSWMFAVARNECFSHFRFAGRFDAMTADVAGDTTGPDPLSVVEQQQDSELLAAALAKLKPIYREVVVLRDYEGFSYQDIAEVITEPESIVKSRLFTARRKLFELLKPYYLER